VKLSGVVHLDLAPECDEVDQCVANCVPSASCEDMAYALHGLTDPNQSMPPGGPAFRACVELCFDP
jgi:hypothetical protein